MKDVNSKGDIEFIVRQQYNSLINDPLTAPVFAHLELEKHLPKIFTFWCFVLNLEAEENPYRGSAFEPHVKLGLTAEHFTKWLFYLHSAIREKYSGEKAEKWITKSNELATMFQYKMGLLYDTTFD